ncbi:Metallo-dependent hydrolase [Pholiota molesta]|nr:Metallo-dependent hydrolase [Pholiota molesta]
MQISGPASAALNSLTPAQINFLQKIPKAELHAHLNGSIPIHILQELAAEYLSSPQNPSTISNDSVRAGIEKLVAGPSLDEIHDFFHLFPAIYALTSTPEALTRAARAVLSVFLDGETPQCSYLELRTTPRATESMDESDISPSLDRRMGRRCSKTGRRVVGLDLCGDPTAGDMAEFAPYFAEAQRLGLGLTLHIAETTANTPDETLQLLSYGPQRLGHATFLNDEAFSIVMETNMCIEICLSSNLLCKTVSSLESHHIRQYLERNHPIAICTDDILPFRTSLLAEYALLLAAKPLGLGLSEEQVRKIGEMSLGARFR